ANNLVFLKGLVRLQACVRRWLTARLLRTRLVQEQVATLAEIAKLARQFHRDIVADNLHRGDVELHKALYKQEGLARERIWRVFIGLSTQEQMSLLRHDRKLSLAAGAEQRGPQTPTAAPAPATVPATHHHHHHHPHHQPHPNRSVGGPPRVRPQAPGHPRGPGGVRLTPAQHQGSAGGVRGAGGGQEFLDRLQTLEGVRLLVQGLLQVHLCPQLLAHQDERSTSGQSWRAVGGGGRVTTLGHEKAWQGLIRGQNSDKGHLTG
ncbi:hypothetical protein O3P69_015560, partial [Scylla paramamosain]